MGISKLEAAQTRKYEAEADAAVALRRRLTLEADEVEHERDHRSASEWESHIYTFDAPVGPASVQECMRVLGMWQRHSPSENFKITFNSPGGNVFDGLALYDFIQQIRGEGIRVDTTALGMAASMGGVLLQAGEQRTMARSSYLLIHEVSSGASGSMEALKDSIKFSERLQERLLDILAERSSLTAKQIKTKWKRKDWWLDAYEARDLGFCDEVV
jgi:ATP-dependent Clp protease protease subunit